MSVDLLDLASQLEALPPYTRQTQKSHGAIPFNDKLSQLARQVRQVSHSLGARLCFDEDVHLFRPLVEGLRGILTHSVLSTELQVDHRRTSKVSLAITAECIAALNMTDVLCGLTDRGRATIHDPSYRSTIQSLVKCYLELETATRLAERALLDESDAGPQTPTDDHRFANLATPTWAEGRNPADRLTSSSRTTPPRHQKAASESYFSLPVTLASRRPPSYASIGPPSPSSSNTPSLSPSSVSSPPLPVMRGPGHTPPSLEMYSQNRTHQEDHFEPPVHAGPQPQLQSRAWQPQLRRDGVREFKGCPFRDCGSLIEMPSRSDEWAICNSHLGCGRRMCWWCLVDSRLVRDHGTGAHDVSCPLHLM